MTQPGRRKTILSWSSGKDCAWALYILRQRTEVEVVGLLTTMNRVANRVAMHAVREELLRAQAAAVGLPLIIVSIPSPCSNEDYEAAMARAVAQARADGIEAFAFGDLALEEIRRYREEKLAPTGLAALFPLWGADTAELAYRMVGAGVRAHVTCIDPRQLDPAFVGRTFDAAFLADLPAGVDPCGENGEFHTFAYEGPMFERPVPIELGTSTESRIVERDGFWFADLTLAQNRLTEKCGSKMGS